MSEPEGLELPLEVRAGQRDSRVPSKIFSKIVRKVTEES
jgi:hypothetical protein